MAVLLTGMEVVGGETEDSQLQLACLNSLSCFNAHKKQKRPQPIRRRTAANPSMFKSSNEP